MILRYHEVLVSVDFKFILLIIGFQAGDNVEPSALMKLRRVFISIALRFVCFNLSFIKLQSQQKGIHANGLLTMRFD